MTLLDGVQARAQEQMLHLARVYPVDRLLAVFRANAGLDTRGAEPPGNWEDFGHPAEEPWGEADYPGAGVAPTASLLRGHYAGHFLSMLARVPALRDKTGELVAGLAEVQAALAATGRFTHPGFLAAYGEWQFSRLEELAPYGEIWAPWYTCHKIMAGLIDAHVHAGNAQALEVVTRLGHWAAQRILRVDPAQRQRMWSLYIAGEYGGMNESMVALHRLTGEQVFLDAAAAFEMDTFLDDAVAGRDVLDGMHANQHLPMLAGHIAQYEATGERRYLDAVLNLWDQIVPGRTFAHGGTGEGELWGPAGAVARFVGRRNAESCATYNLIKIARGLFAHTRDSRYFDYVERASLNHIVGSRADVISDTSPEVLYMYPVDPGAVREYDNVGTCCGGTGLESHVKHQDSIYFRDGTELYVLQYVPSVLDGVLTVHTRYPRDGHVSLTLHTPDITALHLRIPPWASVPGAVNGFLTILEPSGTVSLDLPMPLWLVPTPDDPALVSVEWGPTVLLARDDATTTLPIAPAAFRLLDGSIGDFTAADDLVSALGRTFEPAWSGGDHRYHMYLRLDDERIAFRGADPGVPNRRDQDGWSFLTALWGSGGYLSVSDFLTAVHRYALRAADAGLLTRSEVQAVLVAAASSTLDAPPPSPSPSPSQPPQPSSVLPSSSSASSPSSVPLLSGALPRSGALTAPAGLEWARVAVDIPAATVWRSSTAEVVVWDLPPEIGAADAVPVLRIDVAGAPAASGWYTTMPSAAVTVVSPGPGIASVSSLDEVVSEGRHVLRARATDALGRTVHATREVAVDTAPPVVTARLRDLGTNVEVTLDAVDEVSGVDRIQWRTAETFWGVFQEPFTRVLRDEPQTLEFTATDRAGNTTPVQTVILPALSRD
ncbi:beta-L-arabinofuranosidase domain-containing protein [Symbioplanes lichenis]|uniref:beta-L-arabinofuranosidase domain-containing protein n=1 Tax=Symbioplanes lichenis TaxID=1629072 RepID=UPI002739542C|nr:beta-L-arabinofuranosidase domain-containing protein [Actinoplanes lichenis]